MLVLDRQQCWTTVSPALAATLSYTLKIHRRHDNQSLDSCNIGQYKVRLDLV